MPVLHQPAHHRPHTGHDPIRVSRMPQRALHPQAIGHFPRERPQVDRIFVMERPHVPALEGG
jgi:hypothetical protein